MSAGRKIVPLPFYRNQERCQNRRILRNFKFLGKSETSAIPDFLRCFGVILRSRQNRVSPDSFEDLQMNENEKWMENGTFDILYEEGPVLAVNKESGILTQAPEGIDSLEYRVKSFLIRREEKPGKCYLGIPHRLDRPASGVIVFAKHVRAAHRLSEQFQSRLVEKKYWVLVAGAIPEENGEWTDYMRKIPGRAEAELIEPIHPDAREAVLKYRVLHRLTLPEIGDVTHLEVELETGRTHQIRLQTSSRGFPILGDAQYGSKCAFGEQHEDDRLNAIALHSRRISFAHPMTREQVTLTARLPEVWNRFCNVDVAAE